MLLFLNDGVQVHKSTFSAPFPHSKLNSGIGQRRERRKKLKLKIKENSFRFVILVYLPSLSVPLVIALAHFHCPSPLHGLRSPKDSFSLQSFPNEAPSHNPLWLSFDQRRRSLTGIVFQGKRSFSKLYFPDFVQRALLCPLLARPSS